MWIIRYFKTLYRYCVNNKIYQELLRYSFFGLYYLNIHDPENNVDNSLFQILYRYCVNNKIYQELLRYSFFGLYYLNIHDPENNVDNSLFQILYRYCVNNKISRAITLIYLLALIIKILLFQIFFLNSGASGYLAI